MFSWMNLTDRVQNKTIAGTGKLEIKEIYN